LCSQREALTRKILGTTTLFIITLLIPTVVTAQEELFSLKTLHRQTGAPLQVAGAMFNDTSLKVLLLNVSGREITQVTMGVVMEDRSSQVQLGTRVGNACSTSVPPDGFLVVTEGNAGYDAVATYLSGKGIKQKGVVVGVTHVRFAGGSEWNCPLEAKGRFEEQRDEKLDQKIRDLTEKQVPDKDMSWAFPAAGAKGKFSTCQK
jgi:hypothetical protein